MRYFFLFLSTSFIYCYVFCKEECKKKNQTNQRKLKKNPHTSLLVLWSPGHSQICTRRKWMTWIKVFKKCQYWGEDLPHFIFRLCLELLWEMGEGSVTPRASITIVFNFFFFIGVLLLYNGVFVSAVQQSESAIRIHISPPSWISLPPRSPQSSE